MLHQELNHALRYEPPPDGCPAIQPKISVLSDQAAEKLKILIASGMSHKDYSEQCNLVVVKNYNKSALFSEALRLL